MPDPFEPFRCGWVALQARIDEADMPERGDFDRLLGSLDPNASILLRDILGHLRGYLLDRYTYAEASRLLTDFEPRPGFRTTQAVDDDVRLVLDLLNAFRSAARCRDDDAERPEWFTEVVLGKVGVRDKARQNGTRKPRGSRMPKLDAHIAACLDTNPKATASDIWQGVLCERDDFARSGVYRDGGKLVEYHDERERATGRSGFEKRVTAAKRSRKPRL